MGEKKLNILDALIERLHNDQRWPDVLDRLTRFGSINIGDSLGWEEKRLMKVYQPYPVVLAAVQEFVAYKDATDDLGPHGDRPQSGYIGEISDNFGYKAEQFFRERFEKVVLEAGDNDVDTERRIVNLFAVALDTSIKGDGETTAAKRAILLMQLEGTYDRLGVEFADLYSGNIKHPIEIVSPTDFASFRYHEPAHEFDDDISYVNDRFREYPEKATERTLDWFADAICESAYFYSGCDEPKQFVYYGNIPSQPHVTTLPGYEDALGRAKVFAQDYHAKSEFERAAYIVRSDRSIAQLGALEAFRAKGAAGVAPDLEPKRTMLKAEVELGRYVIAGIAKERLGVLRKNNSRTDKDSLEATAARLTKTVAGLSSRGDATSAVTIRDTLSVIQIILVVEHGSDNKEARLTYDKLTKSASELIVAPVASTARVEPIIREAQRRLKTFGLAGLEDAPSAVAAVEAFLAGGSGAQTAPAASTPRPRTGGPSSGM